MKKRILAILGLIAYILFIIWFTIKGIPSKEEMNEIMSEKNSVIVE